MREVAFAYPFGGCALISFKRALPFNYSKAKVVGLCGHFNLSKESDIAGRAHITINI